MENVDIARALEHVAALLEIQGANPFRVRAYQNAARVIEGYGEPLRKMVAEGQDLTAISYVGKDMAGYIEELVDTGRLRMLDELEEQVPAGLLDVMRLQGVGPKRAGHLWKELGVTSLDELEQAAKQGKIAQLKGFGKKTEQSILDRIRDYQAEERRFLLSEADEYVQALLEHMRQVSGLDQMEVAGSWRRRKETVGDIDVLITTEQPAPVVAHFTGWSSVDRVLQSGDTRASVVLRSGMQVDLRVVSPDSFGAALCYFTGSKAHNIRLRKRALERGLHLTEYGLSRTEGGQQQRPSEGEQIAGRTETEVYEQVDLPWIAPELREDRGEIEAAERGELPALIGVDDIRGDLQLHTDWTDGHDSLEAMLEACAARGYSYVAITDHTRSLPMTGGLDASKVERQWKQMDEVAARHEGIRLLRGLEVDILEDGSLDLDDEILEQLDYCLVTVHSHFELPMDKQTERIIAALEHPAVHAFGHPTARQIGRRSPIALDMDEVLHCARENGVAVECDAQPERLDLSDTHLIRARELGVKVVISSDAHSARGLDVMRYGVEQARRAGFEKGDVLNTRPADELLQALRPRPAGG